MIHHSPAILSRSKPPLALTIFSDAAGSRLYEADPPAQGDLNSHQITALAPGQVVLCAVTVAEVFVSGLFTTNDLPKLLGALDHVIAAYADNIPV
ncbi:MAG: hypothetical protein H7Y38_05420 [Armatimonadetes bacterium]|nr:hypothetical protein [Armatimonadota bacterium]